jgi:2-phosphosulfolactate phosphatase
MKVKVGFTPVEDVSAPLGVVVDVLRATSTICQALASGWPQIVCVNEIDDARALAGPGVALAGERGNVRIDGFDFGNSPREFFAERSDPLTVGTKSKLVLTTTNGTRLLLAAASRCEEVVLGSLLNLDAVVASVRAAGAPEVAILCAGVEGAFALDDAYVAGRIAAALGGEHDDAAVAAARLARVFATAEDGIAGGVSAANIREAKLDDDIRFCARESVLDLVPRVVERGKTWVAIAATSPP